MNTVMAREHEGDDWKFLFEDEDEERVRRELAMLTYKTNLQYKLEVT